MNKKITSVYHYISDGDLVHCNMCDTNMLVPTGADKCPHCYFEGALAWFDEGMKECSVSDLDRNPDFGLITKNDTEMTEYLSDEVLKNEFNMEPNPHHKYKKAMNRSDNKPQKQIPNVLFQNWHLSC
ncbi:hypothetical protein IR083_07855 [Dysgonomonas sp. GY75]|uniref:hypothetical protein n=1 Tax=Dysgonomonas sp. GY75 TaxID=2780419 RepID=UPI00188431FD|nr:hypothetical protein [Dysgonomonas sp. GY75]MBF0648731.1 hypothetical protein [Dysgonomonas sp. GY75]